MSPLVSVIIPTYNRARLISETLESVFRQDYPHIEIIVVDDGSTDDTADVLQKYSDRIVLIRQPNQGIGAARNAGLKAATGEYFIFLDSDDLMGEGCLKAAVDALETHPSFNIVYGLIGHFKVLRERTLQLPLNKKPDNSGDILPDLIAGFNLTPGQYLIRRKCYEKVGGFREKLKTAEDWDYILRLAKDDACLFIPVMFLNRRIHAAMVTLSKNKEDILEDRRRVLEEIFGKETALALEKKYITKTVLADWYRSFGFDYILSGNLESGRRYLRLSLRHEFWQPRIWMWFILRVLKSLKAFLDSSQRANTDKISPDSALPLVSVVIPAYNAEHYIAEAVHSVLNQDYPAKEVIVVDDGSTDKTEEILKTFGEKIRLIRQDNAGESVARNKALREARGEYVMFLDADDIMADGIMRKAAYVLESRPAYRVVYGIMAEFWDDSPGALIINPKVPPKYSGNIFKDVIKGYTLGMGQCMFHRADIEKFGYFSEDIHFGEDWEFMLRLTRSLKAFYLPEMFFKRRNHQRMQTLSSQRPDICDVRLQIIRRVFPNDHQDIISEYLKAPVLADWYRTFGFTYVSRGQNDLAESYIKKSLKVWPYQPELYLWLWNRSKQPWIAVLFVVLMGVLSVFWLTRDGIGISPDSTAYLGAAQSLMDGQGLRYFNEGRFWNFTQWPPLYPLVLALMGFWGASLTDAARFLNIVLMAMNIAGVMLLVHMLTRSQIFSFLAGLLFVMSNDILNIHSWAWSEPLFLFCVLWVFYFLTRYQSYGRTRDLVLSATFAAAAFGCRYVGAAVIACGVLVLFIERGMSLWQRLKRSGAFLVVALAPMVAWMVYSAVHSGSVANRTLMIRQVYLSKIRQGVHTFADWMLPMDIPNAAKEIFVLVLLPLIAYVLFKVLMRAKENVDVREHVLSRILAVFAIAYFMILCAALTLMTASTPLDGRILSPIFVVLLILAPWCLKRFMELDRSPWVRKAFAVIGSVILCAYAVHFASTLRSPTQGDSFFHPSWRQSAFKTFIQELPAGVPVYSNASDGIYFLTGRETFHLPRKDFDAEGKSNPSAAQDVRAMERNIIERGGYIVFFDKMKWRSYLIDEDMLDRDLLDVHVSSEEGVIYAAKSR